MNLSRWSRKISVIQLPCKLRKSRQLVQTRTMPPMSSCQVCSMHVPYVHIRCTPNIVTTQKIEWLHNSHATTHVSVMYMLSFDSHLDIPRKKLYLTCNCDKVDNIGQLTLNELCTSVSSKSMTTQIFPASFDLISGSSGLTGA